MEDETGKEQRGLSPRFSVGFEGQNRLLSKQADESKKKKSLENQKTYHQPTHSLCINSLGVGL